MRRTIGLFAYVHGLTLLLLVTTALPAIATPQEPGAFERGTASYYAAQYHGKPTVSGEPYNHYALTAAHRSLPFGTLVRVTNLDNGRAVVVRVNDRGPSKEDRIINVSGEAARRLGMGAQGAAPVALTLLDGAPKLVAQSLPAADSSEETEKFAVQLAAFSDQTTASEMATSLPGAWVQQVRVDGRRMYRVYYGVFETQDAAREQQHALEALGHFGFVKQVPADAAPRSDRTRRADTWTRQNMATADVDTWTYRRARAETSSRRRGF